MFEQNIRIMREERIEKLTSNQMDTSVYPAEIKACLEVKFEDPPDKMKVLLERVRTFKLTNADEALDEEKQCFEEVKLYEGQNVTF